MSSGSPGRVKHLVPAWWQALQPGSLIVHRIVIIVLSNDLFLWFWQDKEGKRTAVRTREIPILQSGPGETHSHSRGLCVCVYARQVSHARANTAHVPNPSIWISGFTKKIYSNLFTGTTTQTYLVSDFRQEYIFLKKYPYLFSFWVQIVCDTVLCKFE